MAKIKNKLPMSINWAGPLARENYLDYLIKQHQWKTGIEVGVRFGRTLFHLLDNNPTLKMYAVDIDVSQFYSASIREKYQDRLVVLEGNSSEQASKIIELVDFVFIDAAHSKKGVTADIVAYKNMIKNPNGLLGHDIDYPSIQSALSDLNIEFDVCPDNVWHQKN